MQIQYIAHSILMTKKDITGDKMSKKLYEKRNNLKDEETAKLFGNHMMAMTSEDLRSKSDIASELAHRDRLLMKLNEELFQTLKDLENYAEDTVWLTPMETMFDRLTDIYRGHGGDIKKLSEEFDHYPICGE